MIGYRQNGTRPCRNGPNCHFLRNGNCWFSHPAWHHQQRRQSQQSQLMQLLQNIRSMSSLHVQRPKPNILMKERDLDFGQLNFFNSKDKEIKTFKMGNRDINLVKIQCSLEHRKAWFFQNSYHFNYFPQCEHQECSVCLQNFNQEQIVSLLLCNHSFHQNCIEQWLKSSNNCPLCRKDFRLHEQFKKMKGYLKPEDHHNKWQNISISLSGGEDLASDIDSNHSLHFDGDESYENESYGYYENDVDIDELEFDADYY